MTDRELESVGAFRGRARAWLAENMPRADAASGKGTAGDDEDSAEQVSRGRELQRLLFDGGFAGILYPREYGGQGLTVEHQRAFLEEAAEYALPRLFSVTHGILGPTLLDHGSEEQKRRHIPAMLRGEELWVQFLSEPSGGSDMAGVLTRATRDGDTYIVSGAKTWSTGAHFSDYAMVLCRTDWEAPKHRGLSMILMPIRSEGVTVRPIKLANGSAHFCEEFLDEVVLPSENIIGRQNDGWTVASRLLFHERNMVGGNSYNDHAREAKTSDGEDPLISLVRGVERAKDPTVRQLLGEAIVLSHLPGHTAERVNAGMRTGRIPGPGASLLKLLSALSGYRRHEIALEIAGERAAIWSAGDDTSHVGVEWLVARSATVAGGTNEMQRNQISERVLGLPREASPDKGIPFKQVQHNSQALRRG
ncbi:acyl-CoA dehydrogenase family protein [Streptosporangium sp. NPDC002544]|uniref:acyl-CoA dehydrogenase family protein n=1 Tax=Streptosporangium sp. NPDC002544 TaxID=3154538 RepID=UPI0033175712